MPEPVDLETLDCLREAWNARAIPPAGVYRAIVADPPWEYNDRLDSGAQRVRGAANWYRTMPTAAICDLPVGDWAAAEAHLYLWVTNAFMEDGFRVVRAWGFDYKTILTWVKPQIGMGHYFRNNTEHVLFAVRGRLPLLVRDAPTAFSAPRRRHSEKPAAFLDLVERVSPGPRLEVFARSHRTGWDVVGEEVGTLLTGAGLRQVDRAPEGRLL